MDLNIGTTFDAVENDKIILKNWTDINLYSKWIQPPTENAEHFHFVDGPPFVSSSGIHFGHALNSEMKSTSLTYERMNGRRVENIQGNDCHGLPIEMVVNTMLNIKTRKDVLDYGVAEYNAKCKETIKSYSNSWKPIFESIGRITSDQHYKTMDWTFMESCWWVFKQLHERGLVYRGTRVMPYSPACNTPLSNFEASQNYKDITTQSAYVLFPLNIADNEDSYFSTLEFPGSDYSDTIYVVAWTTTPWTLTANMALCVNPTEIYIVVYSKKDSRCYIVAEDLITNVFKDYTRDNLNYQIIDKMPGASLTRETYEPLFRYEELRDHTFRILDDAYVNCKPGSMGSGVVHIAPGFGEDDYRVCQSKGISQIYMNVDENGNMTSSVIADCFESVDFNGVFYKDCSKRVITALTERELLIRTENYNHSYPFCWRTDTELIYRAQDCWFVSASRLREKMVRNNNKINWYPAHVGSGRFHQWIANANDWCISRNRFFGTPLPIWVNDMDQTDIIVVGSIDELCQYSGLTRAMIWGDGAEPDLHPEMISSIKLNKDGKTYTWVNLVLDCWFESGCVPYGQIHYPFSGVEKLDLTKETLCDFICEGIDQTRGWFYTLHVISTALFDKPAFKNVVCGGLILAADGRKMSKRLNNFSDPRDVIQKYGGDALRLYLLSLPATRAESSRFVDGDIRSDTKTTIQWINAFKFVAEHIKMYEKTNDAGDLKTRTDLTNEFDLWIISCLNTTIKQVKELMAVFDFPKVINTLYKFIDNYTNWYLKFNRTRLKGKDGVSDWQDSLKTCILITNRFNIVMAPFMPFLSETMFINLKSLGYSLYDGDSVLLLSYPVAETTNIKAERAFSNFQRVCDMVRSLRSQCGLGSVKQPVKSIRVLSHNTDIVEDITAMRNYFETEDINVLDVAIEQVDNVKYSVSIEPSMGAVYKSDLKTIKMHLAKLTQDEIKDFEANKTSSVSITGTDYNIPFEQLRITRHMDVKISSYEKQMVEGDIMVLLDKRQDEDVIAKHFIRMLIYTTQKLRKSAGIHPWDKLFFKYDNISNSKLDEIINTNNKYLVNMLGYNVGFKEPDVAPRGIWISDEMTYEYGGVEERLLITIFDYNL